MEVRRRLKKNKITLDIKDINLFISSSIETIKRIKNSNMGEEYIFNYTDKLNKSIIEKKAKLIQLEIELSDTINGKIDFIIDEEFTKESNIVKEKHVKNVNVKFIKKEEKKINNDIANNYRKKELMANREHKQKLRDMKYAYNYLNKVIDTIPPYMQKNLDSMPGNKGFIWRGVHLYGSLPDDGGPRIMIMKQGNNQVIHENTHTTYKLFEKSGKDKRILIHTKNKSNM
jgi:hypothetical protein